jgi:hypothetical protein
MEFYDTVRDFDFSDVGKPQIVCAWCGFELDPDDPATTPEWTYPNGQVAYCCGSFGCAMRHQAYANPCLRCGYWHSDCYCPVCDLLIPGETDWRKATVMPIGCIDDI